jgi:peptidoglycan/LPS O-acetylase OafA/YrhL
MRFFWKGHLAVDVFFVLSGFLIADLLMREHARTQKIDLLKYYARRSLRILPVYFFLLCILMKALPDGKNHQWNDN